MNKDYNDEYFEMWMEREEKIAREREIEEKYKNELIEKFKIFLDNEKNLENDIQKFLEKNTELIPLPFIENHGLHFNLVISKFKLGNEYITDFAYLTKSSIKWLLVLIEIETPHKKIFKKNKRNNRYEFSSDFNSAFDQISNWRKYCKRKKEKVLEQIKNIKKPLEENNVDIKYVLIIGKGTEYYENQEKKDMIDDKNSEDIKIMSYDSLINNFKCNSSHGEDLKKIILTPKGDNCFELKYHSNVRESAVFHYMKPEYLKISEKNIKDLKKLEYNLKKWEK